MGSSKGSLRMFVALDLPGELRDRLAQWQRAEIDPIPVLRPIAPQALHITLAFLGNLPERSAGRIAELLEGITAPAPKLRFGAEPVARPPGRPRLFALEAEGEGLRGLQAEVATGLEAGGLYAPERRDFWPHVTVAKVRRERRGSRKPARVDVRPRSLGTELLQPFDAVRIRLYRSDLRPQGAEYVPLSSTDLKVSS